MPRIALIEDHADSRTLVKVLLTGQHRIDVYGSGPEALEAFAQPDKRPDLVLLDISLPSMDGLEILQRLRAQPALAKIPAIALTAHAMAGDRERFLAAGFDAYLSKPILSSEYLLEPIGRLLRRG